MAPKLEVSTLSFYGYKPSIPGNIFALVAFTLLLAFQIGQGLYYRPRWFAFTWLCGLALQLVGYSGRIASHSHPESAGLFILQALTLAISQVFIRAGIYYQAARTQKAFGSQISSQSLSPVSFASIFISFDVATFLLELVGGSFVATGFHAHSLLENVGRYVIIVGMTCQTVNTLVFLIFAHVMSQKNSLTPLTKNEQGHKLVLLSLLFSLWLMFVAELCRLVEFSNGFRSRAARMEWYQLIFDMMFVLIACTILTIFYPGRINCLKQLKDAGEEEMGSIVLTDQYPTEY